MDETERRATYGHASLSAPDEVVAGSFGTWEITYTVGGIAMDDGSRLKVASNVSSDWGRPQFDDPAADNYATVETSGDATVTGSYDDHGHVRPLRDTVNVDVHDGALEAGDTITLTLGDRRGGSLGHQAQTFPERGFELVALIDAFETGELVRVPGEMTVDVVPGPAERLRAVVDSEAATGEAAAVKVRAEDYWGNAATGYGGTLRLEDADADEQLAMADAADGVAENAVSFEDPGVYRIRVVDDDAGFEATTNPLVCTSDGPDERTYWGDIHGQSGETVGTGTIREYFAYARDKAFVDFASHAGNDFQITDEFWAEIQSTIRDFHDPGEFVTFLCYEWSANTPNGGDHNVYFRDDEAEIHRSSSWQVEDDAKHRGTWPVEALYDRYEGRDDVLIIPHQGGRPATLDAYDPDLTPFVEIVSVWGVFEWFGNEALERGYDVGFVGGSDDHSGRLGATYPTNATDWSFPIKGGLMAARAESLERGPLWDAFKTKRCYATTGARILLDVAVAGAGMGETVTADGSAGVAVDASVHAAAPIQRIDLYRGSDRIDTRWFDGGDDRIELTWSGARGRDRRKVQDWTGGLSLDGGRIAGVEEVGFDHPGQGVTDRTNTTLRWDASTAGNYQGLRLDLDAPDDASLSFAAGPVTTTVPLSDLDADEPRVFDAGFLDRQLELRRVGPAETLDAEIAFEDDPAAGRRPYYVRVRQVDGEMAWSSPTVVTVE